MGLNITNVIVFGPEKPCYLDPWTPRDSVRHGRLICYAKSILSLESNVEDVGFACCIIQLSNVFLVVEPNKIIFLI